MDVRSYPYKSTTEDTGPRSYNSYRRYPGIQVSRREVMPHRCVVGGCSNVKTGHIAIFSYPADQTVWRKWDKFIKSTRKNFFSRNAATKVCSEHFLEDDFENLIRWKLDSVKLQLKKGAIPSVRPKVLGQAERCQGSPEKLSAKHLRVRGRKILAVKLDIAREVSLVM